MSAKTLFLLVFLVIVVVLGTILIYQQLTDENNIIIDTLEPFIPDSKPDWWGDETTSGLTEYDYSGEFASKIDWIEGTVQVSALGYVKSDQAESMAEFRIKSSKVGRLRALEKLLETAAGIRFSSYSTLKNETELFSEISTKLEATISGAREVRVKFLKMPDGSPASLVTLECPLNGVKGLYDLTLKDAGTKVKIVKKPDEGATEIKCGLIIDASGLTLLPALNPRILDENGNIVYEASKAKKEIVIERGVVSYCQSVDKAHSLEWIGSDALVVKALEIKGPLRADVVISSEDAKKILKHDENTGFISEANVAFVLSGIKK